MKVIILFLLGFMTTIGVYSQSTLPLRADTVLIEKVGGSAFLKLKDSSRNTIGGILTNIGGGVYVGKKPRRNGDTLFIGRDTFLMGGSQDFQEVLNINDSLRNNNRVHQQGYTFNFDGQLINKDTNRAGEKGSVPIFGVSTDLGLVSGPIQLQTSWPDLVVGNLGYLKWNRAHDGSTLIQYSVGDSSFQDKIPFIPNWDASQRYVILGNYAINEAIHGTDSTTLSTAVKAAIDTLHIGRGWPNDRIIVLNGHRSPAVLAAHSQLPLLALATKNAAINKGVKYFDSYNYTLPFSSWNYSDSIHLSVKGQINLALGLMNTGNFDSVNYTQVNNAHILKTLTVQGYTYLKGLNNIGNDSTSGRLRVNGNFSLGGNFENVATFNKGVNITGDNTIGRRWNLFNNGSEYWGIMMGGSGPYHTDIFTEYGSSNNAVRLGWMGSDGVTFHPLLSTSQTITTVSTPMNVTGASEFNENTTFDKNVSINGTGAFGSHYNFFNSGGEYWGGRMSTGGAPFFTDWYYSYANAAGFRVGPMASDGVTLTPVFIVQGTNIIKANNISNPTGAYNVFVHDADSSFKQVPVSELNTSNYFNTSLNLTGNRNHNGYGFGVNFDSVAYYNVLSNGANSGRRQRTFINMSAGPTFPFWIGNVIRTANNVSDSINQSITMQNSFVQIGSQNIGLGSAYIDVGNPTNAFNKGYIDLLADSITARLPVKTTGLDTVVIVGEYNANAALQTNVLYKASISGLISSHAPTWQQTLNATNGKILTSNNVIDFSGHDLAFQTIHTDGYFSSLKVNDAAGNLKAVSKSDISSTDSVMLRVDGQFGVGQLSNLSGGILAGHNVLGGITEMQTSYTNGSYSRINRLDIDTFFYRMQNLREISNAPIQGHEVYIWLDSIVMNPAVASQNMNLYLKNLPVSSSSSDSVLVKNAAGKVYGRSPTDMFPMTLDKQYTPVGNTGTSETDLFTKTIAANTLTANGQSIEFKIDGLFNDATSTTILKTYFGGTSFGSTGALTISVTSSWIAKGWVIRTGSSTAHAVVEYSTPGATTTSVIIYLDLTGLDFTTTNVFKITGQAGGAGGGTDDIKASSWILNFVPNP